MREEEFDADGQEVAPALMMKMSCGARILLQAELSHLPLLRELSSGPLRDRAREKERDRGREGKGK